jgi:hypothetical protein
MFNGTKRESFLAQSALISIANISQVFADSKSEFAWV